MHEIPWNAKPTFSPACNSKLSMAGMTFNSTATVSCSPGFKGGGIMRCGADASWSVRPAVASTSDIVFS